MVDINQIIDSKKYFSLKKVLFLTVVILMMVMVSGNVLALHDSTVTISPYVLGGGENDLLFTVTACNDVGSTDNIHEFRIYYEWQAFTDFTDVQCQSVTGWWGPYVIDGIWGKFCLYTAKTSGDEITPGNCEDFEFTADTPTEECCRVLRFETRDTEDYWVFADNDVCVDDTPPETTKTYGDPHYPANINDPAPYPHWITTSTPVSLSATDCPGGCDRDNGPHDSTVVATYYKDIYLESSEGWHYCASDCASWNPDEPSNLLDPTGEGWSLWTGTPFYKDPESCHIIEYYSVDGAGNIEPIKWQCVYVDDTPPVQVKKIGAPNVSCRDGECSEFDYWVQDHVTEIELDCDDQGDHPVDHETVCFRVSYDYPSWHYITDNYCDVTVGDDFCCVDAPETIIFEEDSLHDLEFYCVDALGNENQQTDLGYFRVDSLPPIIYKEMIGDDHLGDCPPPNDHGDCYVRDDGQNGVYISVTDDDTYSCAVDDMSCYYKLWWEFDGDVDDCFGAGGTDFDEDGWCLMQTAQFSVEARVLFNEDSRHELYIYCEDALGNWVEDTEIFYVDSTPPTTTKTYGEPTKFEGGYRWITGETDITLDAVDAKVGVQGIYYVHEWVSDEKCEAHPTNPSVTSDYQYLISSGNYVFPSTNEENKKGENTYRPGVIGPHVNLISTGVGEVTLEFVMPENYVACFEYRPDADTSLSTGHNYHPDVGDLYDYVCLADDTQQVTVPADMFVEVRLVFGGERDWDFDWTRFDVIPDTTEWNYVADDEVTFNIPEESCHVIKYFSVDLLNNFEQLKYQFVMVDNTPPYSVKTHGEPYIPDNGSGYGLVTQDTLLTLDCVDPEPHPVDQETLCYKISLDDEFTFITESYCTAFGGTYDVGTGYCCDYVGGEGYYEFHFLEDTHHNLEYYCIDHLGNDERDYNLAYPPQERQITTDGAWIQWYKVDGTPPTTTKAYIPDAYVDSGAEYIDTAHEIELTAIDGGGICAVGVFETYYRHYLVDDAMCAADSCECEFPPEEEEFDLTGDVEGTITKTDNGDSFTWTISITSPSPVHNRWAVGMAFATSTDQPAFQAWYREYQEPYGWYYQDYGTGWNGAVVPLPTEGITATGDHTGQVFTITVPKDKLGGPCETFYWAAQARTNLLGKYPATWIPWSGDVNEYAQSITGAGSGWNIYDVPFGIPEESCHLIEFFSEDNIGNIEELNHQCVFVDKTPPETTKWYEGPQYREEINGMREWITSETDVWLSAEDPEPHPSGVAATWYRDVYLDDPDDWHYCAENCYDWENDQRYSAYGLPTAPEPYNPKSIDDRWEEWTGTPFHKSPESCHIIEYYSYDNVGKVEKPKWQCVFVDNTPPTPEKIVGEPKDMWTPGENGDDPSYFYPEETAHCWDGTGEQIDCWEVTMMTEISLDCTDPDPHPVDHEMVCFNVGLDGEDATEEYCDWYSGSMEDDGFCCVDHTIEEFTFYEETEHNLKYYCVDALGNTNLEIDEEKFKVTGTKFEIPLFKKWNLISVPFTLFNDDPEVVFEDVAEHTDSVWAYDPDNHMCDTEWCVWRPGDGFLDNLRIWPGWGYWVLMDMEMDEEPEWLLLGGELFSTGPVAPPTRDLQAGWNLIGYYGTSWELYDWMDFSFECGDSFDFADRFVYGDKVYCSLNSLVDTQQGYPRWAALWNYINCGDHHTAWLGLNTCADHDSPLQMALSRMYAGRGYWVELDVEDRYIPATSCIWNDDFECRMTGGGIMP